MNEYVNAMDAHWRRKQVQAYFIHHWNINIKAWYYWDMSLDMEYLETRLQEHFVVRQKLSTKQDTKQHQTEAYIPELMITKTDHVEHLCVDVNI